MTGGIPITSETTAPSMASGPLFVVSMWRSGSSLLYALLNKHPQVALMYEADLLLLKPVFLKPKPLCDWAERWAFWNDSWRRHGLSLREAETASADFPHAFASAHQLYARKRGATIWGDKSPNYYDRLNEMADDFPDARFILVWRDPAATANSILRAASLGNAYFSRKGAVHCGLLGYEVFKQECDRLLARGRHVCLVNYEDLLLETAEVMRRVCGFLNIPYDESLAQLEGADRSAIFDGDHHANVKGDKIVRGPRPQLVGAALRNKINRYIASWHLRYGAAWPPYPPAGESATPVGRLQQLADRILYRLLRIRDRISPFVFSFIPISLLRRYRDWKARRRASQSSPTETQGNAASISTESASTGAH